MLIRIYRNNIKIKIIDKYSIFYDLSFIVKNKKFSFLKWGTINKLSKTKE